MSAVRQTFAVSKPTPAPGIEILDSMKAAARLASLVLVSVVLTATLTGCGTTGRFTRCSGLRPTGLPATLASMMATAGKNYGDGLDCTWQVPNAPHGPWTLTTHVHQSTSQGSNENPSRTDSEMESSWATDDRAHVTARVDGLGDGGYWYPMVIDDVATVTVKAFHGWRTVEVTISTRYRYDADFTAMRTSAVAAAAATLLASNS